MSLTMIGIIGIIALLFILFVYILNKKIQHGPYDQENTDNRPLTKDIEKVIIEG